LGDFGHAGALGTGARRGQGRVRGCSASAEALPDRFAQFSGDGDGVFAIHPESRREARCFAPIRRPPRVGSR
jgi:hypothetical protein